MNYAIALLEFDKLVKRVYDEFDIDLCNWAFALNNRKRALGLCDYEIKTVFISSHFISTLSDEEVMDTIIHEIAHAATPGAGHGIKWKKMCKALGGRPERVSSVNVKTPEPKYVASIESKVVGTYHRRPKYDMSKYTVKGDKSTLGKIKLHTYEDFKSLYGEL